jgi:hypothetical protein
MRHPPREILREFGLPWIKKCYEKLNSASLTGRLPRRDDVVLEFLKDVPNDFPDRYGDDYIRRTYWREIALQIWHLFEEDEGLLKRNIPAWKQLDLFVRYPALKRRYSVPEGGTGRVREIDTDRLSAAEWDVAIAQISAELDQAKRRKTEVASAELRV